MRFAYSLALLVFAQLSLAQPAAPVVAVKVERGDLARELQLTGTVVASRSSELSVAVAGQVRALSVDVGDRVQAGDTLLALDPELASLRLQSAQAIRAQVRVELNNARRRADEAEDLRRGEGMAASEVKDRLAEVQRLEAHLLQADADAQHARALLSRHTLAAPFDGVISRRLAEAGEWVGTGTTVLDLVALDSPWLEFRIAEDWLPLVKVGDSVLVDSAVATPVRAKVQIVVPVISSQARTFLLRARLDEAQPALLPGSSVQGRLAVSDSRGSSMLVPRDALIRSPEGRTQVWVMTRDGDSWTVQSREVQVGPGNGRQIAVLEGLREGEQLVVRGNEGLFDGQRVRPVSR